MCLFWFWVSKRKTYLPENSNKLLPVISSTCEVLQVTQDVPLEETFGRLYKAPNVHSTNSQIETCFEDIK